MNEPSQVEAESGIVLFHHHPHCGNVKPRGHCQSPLVLLLIREPASKEVGREGGKGGAGVDLLLDECKGAGDTEHGREGET